MLEENDYESWRIRIERYIKGKPHGKLIWKSIQNGPTPHPQTTNPAPEGGVVPPSRNKRDEEFTELVNDMKVTQLDIPIHKLNTKFCKNLPSYWGKYVTHAKNNMNMSTVMYVELFTHLRTYEEHALKSLKKNKHSSAFVDPLAYLAKTTPTNSTTLHVTLPTPQSSGDSHNDAMFATMNQIANLLSGLQKQFPPTNNQLRTSSNPKTHATVHDGQIVTETVQRRASGNMGTKGIQTTGSGVNNSGKKVICYNCHREGHVARQCKELKRTYDSQWYYDKALLMQAKEKGAVLDAEAEAFLADVKCTAPYDQPLVLTTTNLFEANHEDAYDSDVDEGPHASAAFMAHLSSTGGTNGSSSSHINEQEEHINSKVDLVINYNMITYDEYQNDFGAEGIPTVVSADEADKQSMIAVLQRMHTEIASYVRVNDEHKLFNATLTAELERCKIEMQALEHNKVLSEKKTLEDKYLKEIVVLTNANKVATNVLKGHALPFNYAKLNALYDQFVPHKELSREQVYWLPATEIASQSSTPAKLVAPFVHTRPVKSDVHKKETPKPSPRFTKKPVAPLLKKPKVNVPLSTGIKSTTGASKPASKSNAWIYKKLSAKSAKGDKRWKAGSKGIPAMFE
nr:hypothetical protein [Tanacetum cinerariifolium]